MNRGRFAFLGAEMIEAEQRSEQMAEAIAAALLKLDRPEQVELTDPETWPPVLRRAVEAWRDEKLREIRSAEGVVSAAADPKNPLGALIMLRAPLTYFKVNVEAFARTVAA